MQPRNSLADALFKTVLYSNIFDFPLTEDELWRYFMIEKGLTRKEFSSLIKQKHSFISKKDSYFCISGAEWSITKRISEKKQYEIKISIAKKAAKILSYIPTILFIGISGSLAAGSAQEDSDIDFFIITSPHAVWLSRFFSVLFLSIIPMRRKRNKKKAPNKICLNSFISVTTMGYFSQNPDLYTAHEIAQLHPLIDRGYTYEYFLQENKWYKDFLPNADKKKIESLQKSNFHFLYTIAEIFDPIFEFIQKQYMKKNRTKEVVTKDLLLLHPYNYKEKILKEFQIKMMEYDSLTKV